MFKQIVVGVDGHAGGRDAIALARNLLGPDGKLTLAYVYSRDLVSRDVVPGAEEVEAERAGELLERAHRDAGIPVTPCYIGSSSVGRGLHELADHTGADLLVVGSTRHGLLGRVLIADDTQDALNAAPCAIAIAPAGYARSAASLRKLGVGYDGSPESEHALAVARELAHECHAELSALWAVSVPIETFGPGPLPVSDVIDPLIVEARKQIERFGDLEPHAVYGQAAEELALFSGTVDLLIVGSRGYGPIGRLIHGSTSRPLVRSARCPLLVLPRGARSTTDTDQEHPAAVAAEA
jgi:nucleotide-binding universal stress UspA family protein